jgi:hypothetical protein
MLSKRKVDIFVPCIAWLHLYERLGAENSTETKSSPVGAGRWELGKFYNGSKSFIRGMRISCNWMVAMVLYLNVFNATKLCPLQWLKLASRAAQVAEHLPSKVWP